MCGCACYFARPPTVGTAGYVGAKVMKGKIVGGSPTASHFFLLSQRKSNQKEGDPGFPPLRGALRCSTGQAAAELALRAQT